MPQPTWIILDVTVPIYPNSKEVVHQEKWIRLWQSFGTHRCRVPAAGLRRRARHVSRSAWASKAMPRRWQKPATTPGLFWTLFSSLYIWVYPISVFFGSLDTNILSIVVPLSVNQTTLNILYNYVWPKGYHILFGCCSTNSPRKLAEKVGKGICPECLAGLDDLPFEDVSWNPRWLPSEGLENPLGWWWCFTTAPNSWSYCKATWNLSERPISHLQANGWWPLGCKCHRSVEWPWIFGHPRVNQIKLMFCWRLLIKISITLWKTSGKVTMLPTSRTLPGHCCTGQRLGHSPTVASKGQTACWWFVG